MAAYFLKRLMGLSSRTKPIRTLFKVRLEDRFQYQQTRRLHHPISYRRDSQRTLPPVRLIHVDAPYRFGLVGLGLQLLMKTSTNRSAPPPALSISSILNPSMPQHPPFALTCPKPPKAHPSDRSGHTMHKTETSAPALPSRQASVSKEKVSPSAFACESFSSPWWDFHPSGFPSLFQTLVFAQAPSLHDRYSLLRYYGPLRLPPETNCSYVFPAAFCPCGSPRFLS